MSEGKSNRTVILQARVTAEESKKIRAKMANSTCRKMSDFIRYALLDKTLTVKQRNQSLDDFMTEMIALRKELSAIGTNYNQVVKRLHVLSEAQDIKSWLLLNEGTRKILLDKVEQIKVKINQINDQWLQ